jgi:PAS domain S-box-containing protein
MTQQAKHNTQNVCAPIRREKDILQHMIDCAKNIHLVYLDRDFNFVRVNQAYADTCGFKPEEMVGKNHFALYPHEENEAIFKRVRDTGVPAQYHDKPFTFPDQPDRGTTYWDWTLEPVKDNSGKVIGLIFSLVETTERKRAEEDLARVASFPTLNPNPVFEANFDGNITYSNPAAKSGFGIETAGSSHPLLADWKNVVKTIKSSTTLTREVKAGDRWYLQQLYLVPNTKCIRVYSSDITERKKAEDNLRINEQRYHSLFSNMMDGFAYCQMVFDSAGKPVDLIYLEINDAFEHLTGLKRENVIGRKITEAIPGTREANPEIFDIYGRVSQTGKPERFEVFFKPLGKWFDISVYSPKKGYFIAVFENVTEHKKAEQALKDSLDKEHFLAELVRNASVAVAVGYPDGRLGLFNEAFEKLTGYSSFELRKINWNTELTPPEYRKFEKAKLKEIHTTGCSVRYQKEYIRKDGSRVPIELVVNPFFDNKGNVTHYYSFLTDITERKALQEKLENKAAEVEEYASRMEELADERAKKLKDAERLAAIGATAGMVGHDIRNPLQAITSDLYLIKSELSTTPECKTKAEVSESLEGIEKNIDYINKIVADLQDYARPIAPAAQEVDLASLCDSVLFKSGVPKNINATCKIENEAKFFASDKDLLKRILSNLTNNAVQAMPNGGALTVHACKKHGDIIITLEDTGVGIPEEIKNKLFTPMFTTKSKGQGFGLAVVKRMTEALGGFVTFESQVGKGTKFILCFPTPNS